MINDVHNTEEGGREEMKQKLSKEQPTLMRGQLCRLKLVRSPCILMPYVLTSSCEVSLEKLIVTQQGKKYTASSSVFTKACEWTPS
jgi:hypothetical protein